MTKTAFRNLVISFFALIFLSHSYAQRWVPEDDFKHIKTFNNVLEKTITEISAIKPQDKNGKKYFSNNLEYLTFCSSFIVFLAVPSV